MKKQVCQVVLSTLGKKEWREGWELGENAFLYSVLSSSIAKEVM